MALTARERRKLLEQARAGKLSATSSTKTNTPSTSVVNSQRAASSIREGVKSVRSFQNEVIAEARAKMAEGKKPVLSQFSEQRISAPTEEVPDIERGSFSPNKYQREQTQPIRDFLRDETPFGKLLFGESEQEYQGIIERPKDEDEGFIEGLGKDIQSKGVITGLLYGEVLKSPEERFFINNAELKKLGYEPSESELYARQFIEGDTENIPEAALSQLKAVENTRKAWAGVELLDVFPVFRAARSTLSKSFIRDTVTRSMSAESAVEARRILTDAVPDLKGSEELEELITTIRQVADPVKGEQVIRAVADASKRTRVRSNEAQRVFYQNGLPLVRGGDVAPTTVRRGDLDVPNQTADALALRREINDVIAGEAEGARLSNLDVFADEIKAGSIPFKASVDDQIEMFVSDAIKDASRLRAGDRLATSKEVLEETLEKNKAKTIKVSPEQVVRLSDGTFVYAPKDQLGKGIQATLRGLRESQRAKVAKIERRKEVSTLKKQLDSETQRFDSRIAKQERQAAARAKREAEEAAAKLAREKEEAAAQKILDEQPTQTKRLIDDIDESVKTREKEIREQAKEVNKAVRAARDKIDDATDSLGKIDKAIARERNKARTAIKKINDLVRVSTKEKAKRRAKVIKARDKEIARLTKEKKKLNENLPKLRAGLIKAKGEVFDKDAVIKKLKADAVAQKASLRTDSRTAISKAKEVIDRKPEPRTEPKATATPETPKTRNQEFIDNIISTLKEGPKALDEGNQANSTQVSGFEPVRSDGKLVKTQVVQGFLKEAESIAGELRRANNAEAYENLPIMHKVAKNPVQLEKAIDIVNKDPEKAYRDLMTGNVFPEETTQAAIIFTLQKTNFIRNDAVRSQLLTEKFAKLGTRSAQEMQARTMASRLDYMQVVGQYNKRLQKVMESRGINQEAEVSKIMASLGDDFKNARKMFKEDMMSLIDVKTCKI